MELSSVSASGGPRPRGWGGGAPAWFSYPPAHARPRCVRPLSPRGLLCWPGAGDHAEGSAVCRPASLGLQHNLGSFLSPDSAPPPPGYRLNVLGGEQKGLEGGQDAVCPGGDGPPPRRLGLLQPSQQLSMKNTFILKNIMKNRKTFSPQ